MLGRKITLTWGGEAIDGVREKSIALNGEPVDLTEDDDDGWRTLATEAGENSVNISISGVTKSAVLKTDWFAGTRTKAVAVTWPGGGSLAGSFYLASYTDNGPYNDASTFDCELQSTGEITYTPPS